MIRHRCFPPSYQIIHNVFHLTYMYNTFQLENGLRIIQRPSSGNVIYCGFAIKAGTRDELPGEEGLAHFCEHATFKGTSRRKSWQIISHLEGVGGELNAYTNKHATVYYCAILREHLPRAIDLLCDMVFHSVFPENELEREKEVVCDEIETYNDSPSDLIYDDFENVIFKDHPLGHNILGTKERVRSFTASDAFRFTRRHYRPENAVFFLYGSPQGVFKDRHEELTPILRLLNKAFTAYPVEPQPLSYHVPQADMPYLPDKRDVTSYHQAHVLLGRRAYDINHPRRIALYLLNNILGGPAMSSRLNMSLRERNGLVYTVESSMASYSDTGMWCVYFGCDSHDVKRCLALVRKELDRLMLRPLSSRQLLQAKCQLKGQIALACDSRESFALDFAKSFLHYGWEKDITSLYRDIDALTAEDLQCVAKELFREESITVLRY